MKVITALLVAAAGLAGSAAHAEMQGYKSMGEACTALRSSGLARPLGQDPCAFSPLYGFGGSWDIFGRPYSGVQDPRYRDYPVAAPGTLRPDQIPSPYAERRYSQPEGYAYGYPRWDGYAYGYPRALVDQDGDGIEDHLDNDRDGDGVRNSRDRYPDDPRYR